MSKPITYAAIVLDRSGSMDVIRKETIQHFNEQVQQIRQHAKKQDIFLSLITFNGDVFEHLWNARPEEVRELTEADYVPNGSTALRDAVGYTIQKLLRINGQGSGADIAYLITIISDGQENSSTHLSVEALKELMLPLHKSKQWTFIYMGCDRRSIEEMKVYGIPASNMALFSHDVARTAYAGMNTAMGSWFCGRGFGATSTTNVFSESEDLQNFTDMDDQQAPQWQNIWVTTTCGEGEGWESMPGQLADWESL